MRKKYIRGKRCSKCKLLLPLRDFYAKKSAAMGVGYSSRCKRCADEARRQNDRRRSKLPEVKAKNREWAANNRDYFKEYRREHREYFRERSKARTGLGDDTCWDMYESQQGLCAYCETPLFANFHVDHMHPVSRGGKSEWRNYALTCPHCNLSKGSKSIEEFMEYLMRRP